MVECVPWNECHCPAVASTVKFSRAVVEVPRHSLFVDDSLQLAICSVCQFGIGIITLRVYTLQRHAYKRPLSK